MTALTAGLWGALAALRGVIELSPPPLPFGEAGVDDYAWALRRSGVRGPAPLAPAASRGH